MLKNDSLLSVDIQNLIESRKKTPTVSWSVPKHEQSSLQILRTLSTKFLPHCFVKTNMKFEHEGIEIKMVVVVVVVGLIKCIREGLLQKSLENIINLNSEIILSEITIKNKWPIFIAYRPPCYSNIETFLGNLSNLLNKYLSKYDNVVISFAIYLVCRIYFKITLASLKLTNQVLT